MGMSGDLPHEIWSPHPHNRTHQQRLIKCLLSLVASLQHLAQLGSKLFFPPLGKRDTLQNELRDVLLTLGMPDLIKVA